MERTTDSETAAQRADAPSLHTGPLRSLYNPDFRWLWITGLLFGFGNWMQRITVGWLVLDQTQSVFLTALSFAVRSAPNLVFGPIGGAFSDRYPRRRILVAVAAAKMTVAAGLWLLAMPDTVAVWAVFALVGLAGVAQAFEMPASQALAVDIVGRKDAANGVAVLSIATRAVGAAGAITGGLIIDSFGPAIVFFLGGVGYMVGGLAVNMVRNVRARPLLRDALTGGFVRNTIDGVRALLAIPAVAMLLFFAMFVEVFGFTFQSLMPSVADDILEVDASGLGLLTSMVGLGGLAGSLLVTALSDFPRKGLLALGITVTFGAGLVALGSSEFFALSLGIVFVVGAMAASFDALQWTLLQANVPDEMRGRALGGWIFAIGFGWIGSLELGLVAELTSVGWALTVNGLGLLAAGAAAVIFSGRLRRV